MVLCQAISMLQQDVNKKQEFDYGLPPESYMYMNRKPMYISTDLFIKWCTESFGLILAMTTLILMRVTDSKKGTTLIVI